MPYIKKQDRKKFILKSSEIPTNSSIDLAQWIGEVSDNAGDLNYAITMILKYYMEQKGENYATHNEIIGMLDCCKMEWYRRYTGPYEDEKIKQNGDVN
jgi:hypothetical protein